MFKKIKTLWHAAKVYRWSEGGGIEAMTASNFKSRKFWMTLAGCAGVTAASVQGAPPEALAGMMQVFISYLGGQTAVDLAGGNRSWKSTKFWITVAGSIAIYALAVAEAPPDIIQSIRWLVTAYNGGTALVDIRKARAAKNGA